MTRLFILQVLLFFESSLWAKGDDASEEPSHDRIILHIPIPITTLKHTHAVFKITENGGKKTHGLELYQPKQQHLYTHHHKGSGNRDHKRGSRKGSKQDSTTSKNSAKHAKKENHSQDKAAEEFFHYLNTRFDEAPEKQLPRDRNEELFNRYFRTNAKSNQDTKVSSKTNHKTPRKPTKHDHHSSSRPGRSRHSNHYRSKPEQGRSKKAHKSHSSTSNRNKNSYRGRIHKYPEKYSDDHNIFDHDHGPDDSHESDEKVRLAENDNHDFDFQSEDDSFNLEPVDGEKPRVTIKTILPKLQPNWADEGLISPFALNDVLFKDKKYNKKVFKELGWYPLFLPYEVQEDQEKKK
ncbi:unnamed protein product [Bemisia tabaci]|uniref:Uncharacterized protein n=1 Tax=Bemisia tabaci TaxID=7038 RepID=A0A9P0CAZ3_BEMTA|nr:PREDICTED: uncharacterized protein LOC109037302 [Bemisia tabaci]CAH0772621.1 unnamed protein product [Bemisia tabaci]